jgi:transcription termination/antitermination protein NusG
LLKENENPPISWPQSMSIRDFTGTWWVAHTKSRNEKALAHDLIGKNISYFLPMRWQVRHSKGRKFKTLLPLFGGYLFFCGDEMQRVELLKTNRVANTITINDQQKFIGELLNIEKAIQSGANLTPHKYIKTGQRCRVLAGPLAALEGIVLNTTSGARLILQIDMLGQAASVEIDMDAIELIE